MKPRAFLLTLLVFLLLPAAAEARDRDRDGLPDRWEKRFHLSTKSKSGRKDPDRDGLSNRGEFRSKTSPRRKDTDRDGILDDDEDPDRDRVDNGNELRQGTRPRDRDSDDDRRPDGREDRDRDRLENAAEDASGNDPKDRDSDDDGVGDGAERAGVVTSFATGVLTIDLANGGAVSGLVTPATELECESEDELESFQRGRARSSVIDEDDLPPPDAEPGEGDGDEPGDNDDWTDDGNSGDAPAGSCSAASLVPGARVHEAAGLTTGGRVVFTKIELVR